MSIQRLARIVRTCFYEMVNMFVQGYRRLLRINTSPAAMPEFYYASTLNSVNNNGRTEFIIMPRVLTTSTTALAGSFVDLTTLEIPTPEDPIDDVIHDDIF